MFENIIAQNAALQLRDDIMSGQLAPSMLFFGPPESGKGSTALELARVLSCEKTASWKCSCVSCGYHRHLQHSDLLILGIRNFSAEIAAAHNAFLRDPSNKTLFIRSIRKLLARFSPVLMEDDTRLGKISPVIQSLEERLDELGTADALNKTSLEKLSNNIIKDAQKLESEGMSETIPIAHIRKASYWCRLAPNGKRKTLLLENIEYMRDDGRNSLLKLLEEPPGTVSIVLTTRRREGVLPTILSRLRPYRFLKRDTESEKEIIRRVFRDTYTENSTLKSKSLISTYLDSFLVRSTEKLQPLAAFFLSSLAGSAELVLNKKGAVKIPGIITSLREYYGQISGNTDIESSVSSMAVIKTLLSKSNNFEDDSFSRFLKLCIDNLYTIMRRADNPEHIMYIELFIKHINDAETASGVYNQSTALTLEALFYKLKTSLTGENYG